MVNSSIKLNKTPEGRILGAVPISKQSPMYRIDAVDGAGTIKLPAKYMGYYTSQRSANDAIYQLLTEMWSIVKNPNKAA